MGSCIVCGVDDSSGAVRAASVAARLARDLGSRAQLVHVAESTRGLPLSLRAPRIARGHRLRKRLRAIAEECAFPDSTEVRVEWGDPAQELLSAADKEDAELLVVSSGGTDHASAALVGGVASALMRASPCPVVILPPRAVPPLDPEGLRCVVCGVEGNDDDVRVVRLAADLASRLGGELHAVLGYGKDAAPGHAPEPPAPEFDAELRDSAEERLSLTLAEAGVQARTQVFPLAPADALEYVVDHERAGLTVVGPSGRDVVGFGVESTAIRFAADGSTPLVVVPEKADFELGSGHYEFVAGRS
jgi:nucleotide-binding universal stress UspA family protein